MANINQQETGENDSIKLAVMANDLEYLKSSVDRIDQKLSSGYVTKEEFDPVKRTVYGLITLVLVAVVGALLALVIQ